MRGFSGVTGKATIKVTVYVLWSKDTETWSKTTHVMSTGYLWEELLLVHSFCGYLCMINIKVLVYLLSLKRFVELLVRLMSKDADTWIHRLRLLLVQKGTALLRLFPLLRFKLPLLVESLPLLDLYYHCSVSRYHCKLFVPTATRKTFPLLPILLPLLI